MNFARLKKRKEEKRREKKRKEEKRREREKRKKGTKNCRARKDLKCRKRANTSQTEILRVSKTYYNACALHRVSLEKALARAFRYMDNAFYDSKRVKVILKGETTRTILKSRRLGSSAPPTLPPALPPSPAAPRRATISFCLHSAQL
jgi:hypothetical protein